MAENRARRVIPDEGVADRVMKRVGVFRRARDHAVVLSGEASEDLRRLRDMPPSVLTDLAIGWMCYCRYLSLGSAAEPGIARGA